MASTKRYTKEEIREKVASDRKWAERAVVAIFNRQTFDEQNTDRTIVHNKVGFSAFHAEIMSSFAKQLLRDRHLSGKQLSIAQKIMPGYARQLAEIANGGGK